MTLGIVEETSDASHQPDGAKRGLLVRQHQLPDLLLKLDGLLEILLDGLRLLLLLISPQLLCAAAIVSRGLAAS